MSPFQDMIDIKYINESFHILRFQSEIQCALYTYGTSQYGQRSLHMLKSSRWLMAAS